MIPKALSRIGLTVSAVLFVGGVLAAGNASAGVVYNVNGWTPSSFPGAPGTVPGTWIGGSAPAYSGKLDAVWYADLGVGSTDKVSSAGAVAAGANPAFVLGVGPIGWSGAGGVLNQGMGHGAEIGLIHLESAADLLITMSADSLTPTNPDTVIRPGFSLFEG